MRKTDTSAAYYEVIESEAGVVRMVFRMYTQQGLSINAIARSLNKRGISTRTGKTRWERSVVWAMLRNPAYEGKACYGKTEQSPRQRITRPLRQKNGISNRTNCHRERPRADWIEVCVPALVSKETFALAQEQLTKNKHHSLRRTIEPTLLQGMLVCQQCGYALYRCSTRTSKRKLYYYRCLGADAYRRLKGALCRNRPVRSDYLDKFVWDQIVCLLEDGTLMQAEIDRRKETARNTDPRRQRNEALRNEQARLGKNVERLVTAYQEGLLNLEQLRQRMPELNKKSQAVESELRSLEMAAMDQTRYLQLAESLEGFRTKLRVRAKTLDVGERQQILRLLVKEIIVDANSLTIRHSLPIPQISSGSSNAQPPNSVPSGTSQKPHYLLRSGSNLTRAVEHRTRRTGSGTRAARTPVHAIRGRLQHLHPQSASRGTSDEKRDATPHDEAQTPGQQREKCGGTTMAAKVPRIQLHEPQAAEEAPGAESGGAVQRASSGTHKPDAGYQPRPYGP
jgi:site-specific DNA recombinase